jgi:hypothetical protein
MNYILILGVIGLIAVIAVIAYFMSGKKDEGIKDGKYANEDPRGYWIISKNRVQVWVDERQSGTFIKGLDFDIAKSDMKTTIDGKERVVYVSTTLIDRKTLYIAQSPSGVLYFYKLVDGSLIEIRNDKTFSNLKKVD